MPYDRWDPEQIPVLLLSETTEQIISHTYGTASYQNLESSIQERENKYTGAPERSRNFKSSITGFETVLSGSLAYLVSTLQCLGDRDKVGTTRNI